MGRVLAAVLRVKFGMSVSFFQGKGRTAGIYISARLNSADYAQNQSEFVWAKGGEGTVIKNAEKYGRILPGK